MYLSAVVSAESFMVLALNHFHNLTQRPIRKIAKFLTLGSQIHINISAISIVESEGPAWPGGLRPLRSNEGLPSGRRFEYCKMSLSRFLSY